MAYTRTRQTNATNHPPTPPTPTVTVTQRHTYCQKAHNLIAYLMVQTATYLMVRHDRRTIPHNTMLSTDVHEDG